MKISFELVAGHQVNQSPDTPCTQMKASTVRGIWIKGKRILFVPRAAQTRFVAVPSRPLAVFLEVHWQVGTKDSDPDGKGPENHEKDEG